VPPGAVHCLHTSISSPGYARYSSWLEKVSVIGGGGVGDSIFVVITFGEVTVAVGEDTLAIGEVTVADGEKAEAVGEDTDGVEIWHIGELQPFIIPVLVYLINRAPPSPAP